VGRAGLDVTAPLAAGAGVGALAGGVAGQPVEGRFNPTRVKYVADGRDDVNLVSAADAQRIGDMAFDRGPAASRAEVGGCGGPVICYIFFFPASADSPACEPGAGAAAPAALSFTCSRA